MDYRSLGRTGLRVSELCLGTMQWGWTADEATAWAVMDVYVEAGGNFLDTADVYSQWASGNAGGESEEIIGRWMKDRGNRDEIVVATKVRGPMGHGANREGLGRKHIMEAAEASLRRLQIETIDLYQAHSFDAEVPIEETLRAFEDLVSQGKVHSIGASNYPAWRLASAVSTSEWHGWTRFESLQPHYNLVHRGEFERELMPLCADRGLGVIPYSPLAAGFLTGKYRRGEQPPASERASGITSRYASSDLAWDALGAVQGIARELGKTPTQIALAWMLTQPLITSAIIGANSVDQVRDSLGAAGLRLDVNQMDQLTAASGGPFNWND